MESEFLEETLLMVASSAIRRNKNDPSTNPLRGVDMDLNKFKRKFKNTNIHYIETSRQCKLLLPKEYITNWLLYRFQQSKKDVYLFYTGHGRENGDWALDTYEKPNGDIFTFKQLINLWEQSGAYKNVHLYLFMDSCHSSGWCRQLSQMKDQKNISIFASCEENQVARDLMAGGFMSQCIFETKQDRMMNALDALMNPFMEQTCSFINNMDKPASLLRQDIIKLNKDIRNAKKIKPIANQNISLHKNLNSSINTSSTHADTNIHFTYSSSNITPGPTSTSLDKKHEAQLKQIIIQRCRVNNWQSLNKQQLDLFNLKLTELPQAIGQLTNVQSLKLYANNLQTLPFSVSKLALTELNIGFNKQLKPPSFIFNMQTLKFLNMSDICLQELPSQISNLINLESLILDNNKLSKLPESMTKLTKLITLSISHNPISQYPKNFFQNLPKIARLYTFRTKIQKWPPKNILKQITHFGVSMSSIINFPLDEMQKLEMLQIHPEKSLYCQEFNEFQKKCQKRKICFRLEHFPI